MDNFNKTMRIGTIAIGGRQDRSSVYIKVTYTDGKLSLTGVEGPLKSGDCRGACGQINMSFDVDSLQLSPLWTAEQVKRLFEIWDKWHLNDMRAGCEHQRDWEATWVLELTDYTWSRKFHALRDKATKGDMTNEEYADYRFITKLVYAATIDSNSPKWESPEVKQLLADDWIVSKGTNTKPACQVDYREHPDGILSKPCEVCGYGYGTQWLHEDVPEEVLQELKDFPDTDLTPAWV